MTKGEVENSTKKETTTTPDNLSESTTESSAMTVDDQGSKPNNEEKSADPAPFFNCLTQNGDLGGKVGKLTTRTRLCQLIACAAPVTTRGCGCFLVNFGIFLVRCIELRS